MPLHIGHWKTCREGIFCLPHTCAGIWKEYFQVYEYMQCCQTLMYTLSRVILIKFVFSWAIFMYIAMYIAIEKYQSLSSHWIVDLQGPIQLERLNLRTQVTVVDGSMEWVNTLSTMNTTETCYHSSGTRWVVLRKILLVNCTRRPLFCRPWGFGWLDDHKPATN